mgnify:CR=1 FL=1
MNAPALSAGELLAAARAGDSAACEQVLRENNGLIWSVVRRYYGRGVEPDDLYQLGCLGFLKAVRGFDPSFGTQFSTYAVPKIAGEIRRFLRDDGMIKVSRSIKEMGAKVKTARESLCGSLGREPTVEEIAGEIGATREEVAVSMEAAAEVESLYKNVGNGEDKSLCLMEDRRSQGTSGGTDQPYGVREADQPARGKGSGDHHPAVFQESDPDPGCHLPWHFPGAGVTT